ncbi:amino acid adenylation domain-containing protein [Streptomyces sp. NPDC088812]|uniref:non-ribosomal peptide synthetase n=1 Tax=Streptomyces sp. NPDC088812 TaxID=3365905 RepID=UPI00381C45BD
MSKAMHCTAGEKAAVVRLDSKLEDGHHAHPMTFVQESIWLEEQRTPDSCRYLEYWVHRFRGRINVSSVQAALSRITARHAALRSRLILAGDEPLQIVLPPAAVPLEVRDINPEKLQEALRETLNGPIDLAESPPLRASLLRISDAESVLALALHHAVVDSHSLNVLTREFAQFYLEAETGESEELSHLELQMGDYAEETRNAEASELDGRMPRWQEYLHEAPEETTFPLDRARPEANSYRGGSVGFELDRETTIGVRRLARRLKVTPFVILFSALNVLLHRHSGQTDLVTGTTVSLRDREVLEPLIGCLADIVPLRVRMDDDSSFEDVVRSVDGAVKNTRSENRIPFSRIVRNVARLGSSRTPVCQVVMGFDEPPVPLQIPDVEAERLPFHNGTCKYDMFFNIVAAPRAYGGSVEFSADLFDTETVQRIVERYRTLLAAVLADPTAPVRALGLLPDDERRILLSEWAASGTSGQHRMSAVELFERQRRLSPQGEAVIFGNTTLTFSELGAAADVLCREIRQYDASPGSAVGICLDRSPELAVAVLAVLMSGRPYVPLDVSYPKERLAFMMRDSGMTTLITRRRLAALLDIPPGTAIIDVEESTQQTHCHLPKVQEPASDDLAYVIYTSGSTGQPKGVAMPHGPLANLLDWQLRNSSCGSSSRTLQFAALSFDVSFQEIFASWAAGGSVVLVDEETRRDPGKLLATIEELSIERLFLPFVALQQTAEYACAAGVFPKGLREVITAGEQLYITPAIREFFSRLPHAFLENQYGPSETHVVTALRLTGDPALWPEMPSIGRPITNAVVYLLDSDLRPVPIGVPGEICVGGSALAAGYLGRQGLTAERFVDTMVADQSERLYRTGDIGRYQPGGLIQYLGRGDGQVKIRGHRVEIGEVESTVKAIPGVADAVVVASDADGPERKLVAFLKPVSGSDTWQNAQGILSSRLPGYMMPSAIVPVSEFPLTPSGKIDRRALAQRKTVKRGQPVSSGPLNSLEKALCDIWQDVLGVPGIGVNDDFFENGGNSFSAVRMVTQVRKILHRNVDVQTLYSASTIKSLAERLSQPGSPADHSPVPSNAQSLVSLRDGDRHPPLFCFHALPGTLMRFTSLAANLRAGVPVYGLQARGLDPDNVPHTSIQDMAKDYIAEIRAVQPRGPYAFLGYSMGGITAFEAMTQLSRSGEEVSLLAMVDTDTRCDRTDVEGGALAHLMRYGLRVSADLGRLLNLPAARRVDELLRLGIEAGSLPRDFNHQRLRRMIEMYDFNAQALEAYSFPDEAYEGNLLLFRATADDGNSDDLGWRKYAKEVSIVPSPGDHYHMMDPGNVEVIARLLDEQLTTIS